MRNRDLDLARRYHEATKHSYESVRLDPHTLDWANQPLPFKIYEDLAPVPLPTDWRSPDLPALEAIARLPDPDGPPAVPTLRDLAYLLFCAGGITRRRRYPGGEIAFRAASCTGALYEIELYLVCQDLDGLEAGVYHFGPADFALRQLRRGDYRAVLVEASGWEPAVRRAPVIVVGTGTYWRNAWKYRARTYRHFGWDHGTILANLLAAAAALPVPAFLVCAFVDRQVNDLLGVDPRREVALTLVALGRTEREPPAAPPLAPIAYRTRPLSRREVDYPLMRELHEGSCLDDPGEVVAWRGEPPVRRDQPPQGPLVPLEPLAEAALPTDPVEAVIRRRGSTRRYRRGAAWSLAQCATALVRATVGIPADFLGAPRPGGPLLNELYLIVHAVDGLDPGAYVLHRRPWALERLNAGAFRDIAGYLGLEQALAADAAFVVFFLADLDAVLQRFGNRGYRAVQLEAGILGGKLYLAAYAQRLGASGLTFYDDDVVEFFSPHAAGKSAIFCMTLGCSAGARSI
jgi:SagB-type dehydrogenase family enzyme